MPQVDWWAAGVLYYECLHGHTPFRPPRASVSGESAAAVLLADMRLTSQLVANIQSSGFEHTFSTACAAEDAELMRGLLMHEPGLRFGAAELRTSKVFDGYDWQKLLLKQLPPPWMPTIDDEVRPCCCCINPQYTTLACLERHSHPRPQNRDAQYDVKYFRGERAAASEERLGLHYFSSHRAPEEEDDEDETPAAHSKGWTDGF